MKLIKCNGNFYECFCHTSGYFRVFLNDLQCMGISRNLFVEGGRDGACPVSPAKIKKYEELAIENQ